MEWLLLKIAIAPALNCVWQLLCQGVADGVATVV